MVREWDPRTASSAELESMLDMLNAVLAADLPGDPPWRNTHLREYLSEVMPGERRLSWIAEDPSIDNSSRRVLAHLSVLLLGDIGVIELFVRPEARRHGLGGRLLAEAARRAYMEGFSSIGVEVVGGTPAVGFYESLGFRCAYAESRSVLQLAAVDWHSLGEMARGIAPGYRIEYHPGGPSNALVEAYAVAKAQVRDEDEGDLELRPSSYEPERLRESLSCLHRRGMTPYIVLAIHEESGAVAGLTEVVVPAQHPTRADQYDTIVVPEHRGCGIDRALKARMLFELRAAEPGLAEVQTWNAPGNEAMLKVNAELGFAPDREWFEYEVEVADLIQHFDGGQ